jgi:DNA-binding CsgD family transcriptional regulator
LGISTVAGQHFFDISELRPKNLVIAGGAVVQSAKSKKRTPAETSRRALLVTTSHCEILFAERAATRWLKQFFGSAPSPGLLPGEVSRWLEAAPAVNRAKSLVANRGDEKLFVSRQRPHPPHSVSLLLEVVEASSTNFGRRHRGLTPRESEVLHWLGQGKSNGEIAQILGLKPATVGKHLERIYPKLGVENRTAAAHHAPQLNP